MAIFLSKFYKIVTTHIMNTIWDRYREVFVVFILRTIISLYLICFVIAFFKSSPASNYSSEVITTGCDIGCDYILYSVIWICVFTSACSDHSIGTMYWIILGVGIFFWAILHMRICKKISTNHPVNLIPITVDAPT